jgi:hypothetical protein
VIDAELYWIFVVGFETWTVAAAIGPYVEADVLRYPCSPPAAVSWIRCERCRARR